MTKTKNEEIAKRSKIEPFSPETLINGSSTKHLREYAVLELSESEMIAKILEIKIT